MTTFQIKMIAVITMVIDHIGLFFFPQHEFLRYIGRIAFPLFAWLIANGAYYTHNTNKYLKRLFVLAIISQIPFLIANQNTGYLPLYLNVVFTLFLGLLAITFIKKTSHVWLWILVTGIAALCADIIHSDYGAAGVFSIVFFYIFFNNKVYTIISQTIILLIIPVSIYIFELYSGHNLSSLYLDSTMGGYALLALFCILNYNNKQGLKAKYLFYIFYPLQYVVIILLQTLQKL